MGKFSWMICVGFLFVTQALEADTKRTRQAGFGLGIATLRSRDALATPIVYAGRNTPKMVFFAEVDSSKRDELIIFAHRFRLSPDTATLKESRVEARRSGLRYEHHRLAKKGVRGYLNLFVAGAIELSNFKRELTYDPLLPTETFREVGISLHPGMGIQMAWKGHSQISYHVSFPVVTGFSRNRNLAESPREFEVVSLDQFLGLYHRLTWVYRLPEYVGIRVAYEGQFYRHANPETLYMGVDQVSTMVFLEF